MPPLVRSLALGLLVATSGLPLLMGAASQPGLAQEASLLLQTHSHMLLSQAEEQRLEAARLLQQGIQQYQASQYSAARDSWQQALDIYRSINDRNGEAGALTNLGNVYRSLRQYPQAREAYTQALAIFQHLGDRDGEAIALTGLGIVYRSLGQYPQAIEAYSQALAIFQDLGDRDGEARALTGLGSVYDSLGQYPQAREAYSQALAIFQHLGDRNGEANAVMNLGNVYASLGQYPQARENYSQALAIFQDLGDRNGEANAWNNLGVAYQAQGQWPDAEKSLRKALEAFKSLRPQDMDAQDQLSLLDQQFLAYRTLQAVLIAQGRPNDALEISESGRTRALITTLAAKLPSEVQARLNLREPTLTEIKQIAAEQNATLVEYSLIDNPHTPDDAVDGLILIWVVKPDRTIAFASSPLPDQETLTNLTDIFPQLSGTGEGPKDTTLDVTEIDQTLEQLYSFLIAPIADQLPKNETERVIFIPHEELFRVPFAALRNPDTLDYLIGSSGSMVETVLANTFSFSCIR